MENLPWLFGAFAIGWALIFVYLYSISRRERDLRRRVDELREMLERRD